MDGEGVRYHLREARGGSEFEAVFRFRYEHFFHCFTAGYPGLDHAGGRVFEPHDEGSTHYCAFDDNEGLCAVSTATPAGAPDIPAAWREWFQLARFAPERVVVSTRMVIRPDLRHNGLFDLFYRFIMESYLENGFDYAVHYCSPGLLCRYEHLGHRLYGEPFILPPGVLRVPMLFALDDVDHLLRLEAPNAGWCARRALRSGRSFKAPPPGLNLRPNFRLFTPEERLSYVRKRSETELPESEVILPVLEHASPLYLRAGLSHTAPFAGDFLCLVLSGELRKHGSDIPVRSGAFVGTSMLLDPASPPTRFTVASDAEVLIFDQTLTWAAFRVRPEPGDVSAWKILSMACRNSIQNLPATPGVKDTNSCGTQL
jgi:hypothetical protein